MFQTCPPPPDLAAEVALLWAVPLHYGAASVAERVLPDGCCELVLHLGDRVAAAAIGEVAGPQPLALLHGQLATGLQLWTGDRVGMIAVRFRPYGVQTLFGLPPQALHGRAVDLGQVFGEAAVRLLHRVRNSTATLEQWRLLVEFLRAQRRPSRLAPWLQHACIELDRVDSRIERVAQAAGISLRQLERSFRAAIGLEPKQFQLLRRLAAAGHRLEGDAPLSHIAHDAGFSDQSHFGRSFRAIAGCTPLAYRRERRIAAGWIPTI